MTVIVNQSSYVGKPVNVNVGRQMKDLGPVIGLIGVVPGTVLNAEARANLKTFFEGLAYNDNPYARCYALHGLVGWEEANGDPKTESLPNGVTKYLADGKPTYTVRFDGGGFDFFRILRSFKNSQNFLHWFVLHETREIGGKVSYTDSGDYDLKPLSFHQLFPFGRKFATSSNAEPAGLYIVLNDTHQINEGYGYIDLDFDIKEATSGITDVHLEVTSISATKYAVKAFAGYTKQDMSVMFPTELSAPAAFPVKDLTSGTTLTVTGVAPKVGYFEVTLSAAPTAGHKLRFSMGTPSVLDGLGVSWFESDYIDITAP